jgi:2-polyprenyl-6-methoxyphenol hydroxylase-like FAD-dependent oxidoreductase
MTDIRTAVVIGGGIAGPVTAIALQRAGIDATVYEAYATAADGVGGMLGLAPNGLDALAAVELDHVVRGLAQPVSAMVIHSGTGKPLARFADPAGAPILHVIWRADLYRALYEEARRRGIRIQHGHRYVRADDTGDGATARFADGSAAHADILIGADGVRSTVRSLIDPAAPPPRYTGLLGFGGWTSNADVTGNDDYHMIFGRNASSSSKDRCRRCVGLERSEQQVGGGRGAGECPSVAHGSDERVVPPELEGMLHGEPQPVGRVHKRERADGQQAQLGQRITQQREHTGVVGRVHQAQRYCHTEQHDQDGQHEGGHHAPGAEQQPDERLRRGPVLRGHHLRHHQPGQERSDHEPPKVDAGEDGAGRHPAAPDPHHHGPRREVREGDGVQ